MNYGSSHLIGAMSLRLGIPWRVALQQCSPPLPQPNQWWQGERSLVDQKNRKSKPGNSRTVSLTGFTAPRIHPTFSPRNRFPSHAIRSTVIAKPPEQIFGGLRYACPPHRTSATIRGNTDA